MKHEKRVHAKRSKGPAKTQTKTAPVPGEFDQSKWGRGLAANLKRLLRCVQEIINHPCETRAIPYHKQLGKLSHRIERSIGWVKVEPGLNGPKIILEGRWLEEAGFRVGDAAAVHVTTGRFIDLQNKGGAR